MKKEAMLNNMMVGNGVAEKGGKEMVATILKENETTIENNEGGNKMLKENEAVRCHCLHCNAVLNKKGRKYCDRDCYNASRKSDNKNKPTKTYETTSVKNKVQTPAKAPETGDTQSRSVTFEKAILNMRKFESALTLHRLKKLTKIAGERALVIRVDGGVAIYWGIDAKCYVIFYRPGRTITCRRCEFEEMKSLIEKCMKRPMFKDSMKITEYIALAEKMKGGE